jgi:hypothetical protein
MPREQIMTYAAIKQAAIRAYRAGKLTAQQKDGRRRLCVYRLKSDPKCGCPVGMAMTPRTLARVQKRGDNDRGIALIGYVGRPTATHRLVRFATQQGLARATTLQRRYDIWCRPHYQGADLVQAEADFCALLGIAPMQS